MILDGDGAEKLLGCGDMLYQPVGVSKPVRIQGSLVGQEEVDRVVCSSKKTIRATTMMRFCEK